MLELSVIIAAYNEEFRLVPTLTRTTAFLRDRHIIFEILIVNDGSKDKTKLIVESLMGKYPELRLVSHHPNRGRGASIREGVLNAKGEYILESDADGSVSLEAFERFLNVLRNNKEIDVIIGSREMKGSIITYPQPFLRVFLGYGFIYLTKFLFWAWHIHDFTLGFKMFRREVAQDIFKHQFDNHYVAEAEIVFAARKRGWHLLELPVTWSDDRDSRVRPVRDSFRSLRGLAEVFTRNLRGKYGKRS
ncbi:MAG TPA: glycosyltransferase [Candidatus Paceibacterota bacterium]